MFVLCRNPSRESKYDDPCAKDAGNGQLQWTPWLSSEEATQQCEAEHRRSGREDGKIWLHDKAEYVQALGDRTHQSTVGRRARNRKGSKGKATGVSARKIILHYVRLSLAGHLTFCKIHLSQHSRCIIYRPASPAPLRHNEQAEPGFFMEFS